MGRGGWNSVLGDGINGGDLTEAQALPMLGELVCAPTKFDADD